MDAKLKVVSPVGENVGGIRTPLARRLDTLEGKTIGEIWNGGFKADVSFPIIEQMLRERYPTVKFVSYKEFPAMTMASLEPVRKAATLKAVRTALLEKGCDAVITGNGG
ncbi:MAG: hypothetical protein HYU73_19500 [Betaproteobacteria bacterium]|nr:hypothetical protein [Betaproteobacteria bacterium]MBI3052450.1 hypothetical protein [Betaproteobacteria bacterium]